MPVFCRSKSFYMKLKFLSIAFMATLFCFLTLCEAQAQKAPKCVKTASIKRPTHVLASVADLNAFYKNYQSDGTSFKALKIVKSELAYYLLASVQNGTAIFAFELELKGKKLYLNRLLPVQSCSEGELSLDTFLQEDGKITGCRMGSHTIKQIQVQ
jgi:hypothetical protein